MTLFYHFLGQIRTPFWRGPGQDRLRIYAYKDWTWPKPAKTVKKGVKKWSIFGPFLTPF